MATAARTARSASSSWTWGTPKTAMTASPAYFSTTPPKARICCAISSKYAVRSARSCSGSCRTASSVDPARSAKSTVTSLRSSAGGIRGSAGSPLGYQLFHRVEKFWLDARPRVARPPALQLEDDGLAVAGVAVLGIRAKGVRLPLHRMQPDEHEHRVGQARVDEEQAVVPEQHLSVAPSAPIAPGIALPCGIRRTLVVLRGGLRDGRAHVLLDALHHRQRVTVVGVGHRDHGEFLGGPDAELGAIARQRPAVAEAGLAAGPEDAKAETPARLPVRLQPMNPLHFPKRAAAQDLGASRRAITELQHGEAREVGHRGGHVGGGADAARVHMRRGPAAAVRHAAPVGAGQARIVRIRREHARVLHAERRSRMWLCT